MSGVRQTHSGTTRTLAATFAMLGLWGVRAAHADDPLKTESFPPPPSVASPNSPAAATVANPAPAAPPSGLPKLPSAFSDDTMTRGNGNGGTANGRRFGWLFKDLTFSGNASAALRSQQVAGSPDAVTVYNYENGNRFDERNVGPFRQNMDLTIQGKVLDVFSVNARLSSSRYNSYANQTFGINYDKKGTRFQLGDVNAALGGGNSLVAFNKTLQGVLYGRDIIPGRLRFTGIASLTRAVTRRGSFGGQDTRGPYFLNASAILEGTERLRLNGKDLIRGDDYQIDYLLGQVTFSTILPPGATVEYSYESQNYNSTPGILTGGRVDMAAGGANVGVTYITQKARGGTGGDRQYKERFPITSNLNDRYTLLAQIEPNSTVEVRFLKQAEPLVENLDYRLNRELHYVQLLRALPPDTYITADASLMVTYTPVRGSSVVGDREVLGVDSSLRLGNVGNLALAFGRSQSPDGSASGSAMSATASFRGGGANGLHAWNGSFSFKNQDPRFSGIDSVTSAFSRAEKGFNANLQYAPNPFVTMNTSLSRSRVAQTSLSNYYAAGTASTTPTNDSLAWANNATWNTNVSVNYKNLPTLNFGHSQVSQDGTSRSVFTSDNLQIGWRMGSLLSVTGNLGRSSTRGNVFLSGYTTGFGSAVSTGTLLGDIRNNTGSSTTDSSSTTANLNLTLTPAPWISLTSNIGSSSTKYLASGASSSASNGRANDISYGITLNPLQPRGNGSGFQPILTISANYNDTNNGQSTSSFYSSSTTTGSLLSGGVSGQRTRGTNMSVQFQPFQALTLNLNMNRSLSLIPGYDNTENVNTQLGFTYTPFTLLSLTGSIGNQRVIYVGNQGDSNNKSYNLTGSFGPIGRLRFTASLQRMNTGSSLAYNNGTSGNIPGIGGVVGSVGSGTTNLTSYDYAQRQNLTTLMTRADLDIGGGRSLYLQWQSLDTLTPFSSTTSTTGTGTSALTGTRNSSNSLRGVASIGMDIRLTPVMGINMSLDLVNLRDREDPRYSYRARSMNMDLSARF